MGAATRRFAWIAALIVLSSSAAAGTIDTGALERRWPKERVRETEVGRYPVRWREWASRKDGVRTGVRFLAPLGRQAVWDFATDYKDVGTHVPGVTAVRFLEESPTRQVIQLDIKVLWKILQLTFEVERDPPNALRFRLANQAIGEYLGLCTFEEASGLATRDDSKPATTVELSTWLKPSRPIPLGLVLLVERMTLLPGVKNFLKGCEQAASSKPQAAGIRSLIAMRLEA